MPAIKRKLRAIGWYLYDRAGESSTWRGLMLLATVLGAKISTEKQEAIILVGLAATGIIGVLLPDRK